VSEDDPVDGSGDGTGPLPDGPNVIRRAAVLAGHPECPLCERQLAVTKDHLVAFGPDDDPTPETADAVACPVCDGVSFVVE